MINQLLFFKFKYDLKLHKNLFYFILVCQYSALTAINILLFFFALCDNVFYYIVMNNNHYNYKKKNVCSSFYVQLNIYLMIGGIIIYLCLVVCTYTHFYKID
jgi:hypothetical protein